MKYNVAIWQQDYVSQNFHNILCNTLLMWFQSRTNGKGNPKYKVPAVNQFDFSTLL
jgi:hypothetical protein